MTNFISIFFTLILFFIAYNDIFIRTIKKVNNSNSEISQVSKILYQKKQTSSNKTSQKNQKKYILEETSTVKLFDSKQKSFSKIQSNF